MSIPLNLLETFITFVNEGSLVNAARKLGLTQPAVSIQIKQFEDYFNFSVFTIQGKRKVLTPQGRVFFNSIEDDFNRLRATLKDQKRLIEDGTKMNIRIAARRDHFSQVVDEIEYDGSYELVAAGNDDAIEMILANKVDFAIVHKKPNSFEIIAKDFKSESFVFACHKSLKYFKNLDQFMDECSFKDFPFFNYKTNFNILEQWFNYCGIRDFNALSTVDDWRIITDLIKRKKGFSLLPYSYVKGDSEIRTFEVPKRIIPMQKFYILQRKSLSKKLLIKEIFKI